MITLACWKQNLEISSRDCFVGNISQRGECGWTGHIARKAHHRLNGNDGNRMVAVRSNFDEWLAELGRPPLKVIQFGSLEAILGCVLAGMGGTFMPKAVKNHDRYGWELAVHPVPTHFATIPTMFVRRRDMAPSANLKAFLEIVRSRNSVSA